MTVATYPSVTEVLSPWADWSKIPPKVLAHAAARGTRVHAACAAIAMGLWPVVDEETEGYVDSFRNWFGAAVAEVVLCEAELVEKAMGYCGHPDLIVRIHGDEGLTVADLKTPATKNPLWGPQVAAYRHLATVHGFKVERCMSVRLKKDGSRAIVDEYTPSQQDWAKFVCALNAWKAFN